MAVQSSQSPQRILRMPHLLQRIPLSRAATYDRLNPKSPRYDASFPKPIRLGPNSVGWLESEVEDWIKTRIEQRTHNTNPGSVQ